MRIRLVAVSAIALCFSLSTAYSQIAVGPKAGINFNSFRGNDRYDVIPGFNVGGFAKYPFFDFLSLRAELLYMQQGANTYDYEVINPDLVRRNTKVRFHNLQIPVMAELQLPGLSEEAVKPKLWVGAFYSTTLYARESYDNIARVKGYDPIDYSGRTNVTSLFNRSQYGIIGGIGGEVKIFSYPVSLEFRYNYNLSRANRAGTQGSFNLANTATEWGDKLYLATLSFNVAVTMFYF